MYSLRTIFTKLVERAVDGGIERGEGSGLCLRTTTVLSVGLRELISRGGFGDERPLGHKNGPPRRRTEKMPFSRFCGKQKVYLSGDTVDGDYRRPGVADEHDHVGPRKQYHRIA